VSPSRPMIVGCRRGGARRLRSGADHRAAARTIAAARSRRAPRHPSWSSAPRRSTCGATCRRCATHPRWRCAPPLPTRKRRGDRPGGADARLARGPRGGREARGRAATRAVQAAQWCGRARRSRRLPVLARRGLGVQARERPTTGASALPAIEAPSRRPRPPTGARIGRPRPRPRPPLPESPAATGPGDPDRGLEHARRAMAAAADHPPNMLALARPWPRPGTPRAAAPGSKRRSVAPAPPPRPASRTPRMDARCRGGAGARG